MTRLPPHRTAPSSEAPTIAPTASFADAGPTAPPVCTIIVGEALDAITGPDLRARIIEAGLLGYDVCVDLSETLEMDAAGLAAIIGPRRRLRAEGLDVFLRGVNTPGVLRTLSVTRFAPLFDLGGPASSWR